jgi:hypothetical protein
VVIPPNAVLDVDKTIEGSFEREYKWTIAKDCGPTPIVSDANEEKTLKCTITVGSADPAFVDSKWKVFGTITLTNPSQTKAIKVTGVSDNLLQDAGAVSPPVDVVCLDADKEPLAMGFVLAAGGSQKCTYEYSPKTAPTATTIYTNTAAATYEVVGDESEKSYSAESAPYVFQFDTPTSEKNKKVTITDSKDTEWSYTVEYGVTKPLPHEIPFEFKATAGTACTKTPVENTASIKETGQSTRGTAASTWPAA